MEEIIVSTAIILIPALVLLVPGQFSKYRKLVNAHGVPLGNLRLLTLAIVTILGALAIGMAIGLVVLIGPSIVTGISFDLLWFTMYPALAIGLFAAIRASRVISQSVVKRITRSS